MRRTTSAPRGQTPVLRSRGNHWDKTSVAALGYRRDGRQSRLFARTQKGSFDTASLIDFLRQLKRFVDGQPILLIWDRLPAHRSGEMKRYLQPQQDCSRSSGSPATRRISARPKGVWNNIKGREVANVYSELMSEATHASFLRHDGLSS